MNPPGTVHLVGAGPGDPGLVTRRGAALLAGCDCVVHDMLVSDEVLAMVRPGAERIFVGKQGRGASVAQEDINRILVACAQRHACTVRLKGGDPFVFGRGGEEAVALAAAGIPFSVVPGVTSGIGAPAYAGIPVTHRASSSAVAFVTGHQQHDPHAPLDWGGLARIETLVFYMGMHRLAENCAALVAAGRDPSTPAAVVQWGTRPGQRTVTGTLADLAQRAADAGIGAPAITVVGEVVRYRERIAWFDRRPLSGRRVLVTRAQEQAGELADALAEAGAAIVHLPLARIVAADPAALDAALRRLGGWRWMAFTSRNAVEHVWARIEALGLDARACAGLRLGAVGPGTAAALAAHGLRADAIPDVGDGAHLAQAMIAGGCGPGTAVLLPQADNARPHLAEALRAAGCAVDAVIAYRSEPLPATLPAGGLDAAVFASAATVDRLADALGPAAVADLAACCRAVAIGPGTASALRAHGWEPAAVAGSPSIPALVAATAAALAGAGAADGRP